MKALFFSCLLFLQLAQLQAQNIGINANGAAPFAGAILDVQSTTHGVLFPRMTTTQRLGLSNLTNGLLVFDTDLNEFMFFANTWQKFGTNQWSLGGNIGLGVGQFMGSIDATPVRFRSNNIERLRIEPNGNILLPGEMQTLQFAATTGSNVPMMQMFSSGTQNRDRMVIAHSSGFPKWGLEYRDTNDVFFLRENGQRRFAFELATGHMGIGVEDPVFPLDIFGKIRLQSVGDAVTDFSGIWFANRDNTFNRALLGMSRPDSTLGIFSQHMDQWAIEFDVMREPRIGINTVSTASFGGDGVVRAELHVAHTNFGGSNDGIRIQNLGANFHYWNLYTSNTTGAFEFYKQGIKRATIDQTSGAYTAVSDRNVKRNIAAVPTGTLAKIMQLQPTRYQFAKIIGDEGGAIESDRYHYGFIAQDVEPIFPELVFKGSDNPTQNYYTMNYSGFGVLAIQAIQEQQKIIQTQQQTLASLQTQLADLQRKLDGILRQQ